MKLAIAGDSAGKGAAGILAVRLKDRFDVSRISRTGAGADACYANLPDCVASQGVDDTFDHAVPVCGTATGVCIPANKARGIRAALTLDTRSDQSAALSSNAQDTTMAACVTGAELAKANADAWRAGTMNFDVQGRRAGNVDAIDALDEKYSQS